jgi:hypothetical protein
MALNFPNSPTNGQIYTDSASGNRWVWDSGNTCWVSTSTFTQTITVASSAPGSPVAGQLWWNKDYGRLLVYYTDDNTSQWVDASPSDYTSQLAYNQANTVFGVANAAFGVANTALQNTNVTLAGNLTVTGNVIANKQVVVTYTPTTSVNAVATLAGANTQGGTGYVDFLKASNLSGGATNPHKTFRLNSTGGIEVINSAYSANLLTLDDNGRMLRPYQPMVYAHKTTGGWTNYYNGGNYLTFVFDTASINVGNSYNASTGIFTCPISGYYKITASILLGNASGSAGFYCYRNAGVVGQSAYAYQGGNNAQTTYSWLVGCSTNDTLKIVAWSSSAGGSYASVYEAYYNFLQIELIG